MLHGKQTNYITLLRLGVGLLYEAPRVCIAMQILFKCNNLNTSESTILFSDVVMERLELQVIAGERSITRETKKQFFFLPRIDTDIFLYTREKQNLDLTLFRSCFWSLSFKTLMRFGVGDTPPLLSSPSFFLLLFYSYYHFYHLLFLFFFFCKHLPSPVKLPPLSPGGGHRGNWCNESLERFEMKWVW